SEYVLDTPQEDDEQIPTCVVQYHGDLKGPCVSTLPSIRHPAQRGLKEKKKKKDKKEKKKTKRYSESPAYCGVEFVVGHM
ncbi:hypothetical protein OFB51_27105, partial [Escherichia coli]|nr:hypothetical protein [Escherichia coli]